MNMTSNPVLLPFLITSTISLMACGGGENSQYSNDDSSSEKISTVLYQLTQSEYDKIDATKLSINNGKMVNESIYRATGSGSVAPEVLNQDLHYVIADNYFATDTKSFKDSNSEKSLFYTDRVVKKLIDKQSGKQLKLSTSIEKINLSGYKPYEYPHTNSQVYISTVFSDWRGTLGDESTPESILNISFPKGSACYHTTKLTTSQDAFITNPNFDKTIATDLSGFKLIATRVDAQRDDLKITGDFKDVVVGTRNQLPATYAPTQRLYKRGNQTEIVNFFGGGVLIGNNFYNAILHKANVAVAIDEVEECSFYNEIAAEYIISQFKVYAK